MKKGLFAILVLLIFVSCDQTNRKKVPEKREWVYVEIFYVLKRDTTINYLYGKISSKDLAKFDKDSQDASLFKLTDGRYIDTNDKVQAYGKDNNMNNDGGTFHYRFKDVIRLEIQKSDPLEFYKSKEDE